jgi:hypothetical protein
MTIESTDVVAGMGLKLRLSRTPYIRRSRTPTPYV